LATDLWSKIHTCREERFKGKINKLHKEPHEFYRLTACMEETEVACVNMVKKYLPTNHLAD
jgi:hypothetical protein